MTAPAAALALKVEGQALAGRRATSAHRAAFVAAVRAIPVGRLFTVNDLRAQLDGAGVPPAARASLMAAAAREGLAERAVEVHDGVVYELKRPSSGRSARGADVTAWRRTDPRERT